MQWPWSKRETRAESSYTEALVALLAANAGGEEAVTSATGALEACAGFVGRGFASADVDAPGAVQDLLTPACLSMVGRALIRRGEIVLLIRVMEGRVVLLPVQSHDILGGPDPDSWVYRCTVNGPDVSNTYETVPAASVIHVRYAVDPERPWRGYGPLDVALLAGRLSAETANALADEAGMPRGALLPLPIPGNDPSITELKADIRKLKGQIATVESVNRMATPGTGPGREWELSRIGASPPDAMVTLHERASLEVYAACGLHDSLFRSTGETAAREAYRQALHSCLAPLGAIVAAELTLKLETEITLDWRELRAGDIAGRARAFQSMVGGGMDVAKAAALSGLVMSE